MADDRELAEERAHELGVAFIDLARVRIDVETARLVSRDTVLLHRVFPVKKQNSTIWLATDRPNDETALSAVRDETDCRVVPVLAESSELDRAIAKYYC